VVSGSGESHRPLDDVIPIIYASPSYLRRERRGQLLQTTALLLGTYEGVPGRRKRRLLGTGDSVRGAEDAQNEQKEDAAKASRRRIEHEIPPSCRVVQTTQTLP
jgi:hypothetical protein